MMGTTLKGGVLAAALLAAGTAAADTRNGRAAFEHFRKGLAEPTCNAPSARHLAHYAHAPRQLAERDETLATFAHVVDALRAAQLPTEYALIPFVESGYKPAARSPAGPAGLWQFIASTARNHKIPMRPGYDGRLSPVDSTRAAVRYLKTLHGMFGGNWRLAVMAYNVGEGRIFSALRRSGQSARTADATRLDGLPEITRAYDDKLHALACIMTRAEAQPRWMASLDRPVRRLGNVADTNTLIAQHPTDTAGSEKPGLLAALAPSVVAQDSAAAAVGMAMPSRSEPAAALPVAASAAAPAAPRRHTVAVGDNLWRIARRYGTSVAQLLALNGLDAARGLAPGTVLKVDALAAR